MGVTFPEVVGLEAIKFTDVQLPEAFQSLDREAEGFGDRGGGLQGASLGTAVDGFDLLGGKPTSEGLGLGEAGMIKPGVAGALETALLIGVGLSMSNEDNSHMGYRKWDSERIGLALGDQQFFDFDTSHFRNGYAAALKAECLTL